MRRRVSLAVGALVWLALSSFVSPLSVSAQAQSELRIVSTPDATEINDLLDRGRSLETQRRWGEAVTHYEDALRHHPGEQTLERRFDVAKIHYDVARRYGDSSFKKSLGTLREDEALDLYAEVLLKVNAHYVTQPSWQDLCSRGTRALDLALGENGFVKNNLPNATSDGIEDFRRSLREQIATMNVSSRYDAREVAATAAHLGQQKLGLAPTAVIMEYTCGATGGLDEYSSYLTGEQLTDVYSQIEGNFVGLGIELKGGDNGLVIMHVIHGSPAERGGIVAGDRITSVNNRSTTELSTDQAAELLQGPEGSLVDLVAVTPGQSPRRINLRREHVEVPSIDDVKIVDREYGIGYLKLTCFEKTTSRDLDEALWQLNREGMKSLVMDLRGNPGGLLTASVEVADKFIDEGTIVSTRGRNPGEDFTYTARSAGTWHMPLVVLIDGDSASASEIFAGAIRDHKRGTLVGERSYGKGSVQGIFPLSLAGAGVRLTTSKFYSPNGLPYVHVGVTPDIVVHNTAKPVVNADGPNAQVATGLPKSADDPELNAALQAARQQVAQR